MTTDIYIKLYASRLLSCY